MPRIMISLATIALLGLSACATIDTSTLETARTLNDKSFEVGLISSKNLNLNSAVSVEKDYWSEVESHDEDNELSSSLIFGPRLDLKITNGLDFCGRIYSSGSGEHWGTRLGIKKQLVHQGRSYLSIMPSFSYLKGTQFDLDFDPGGSTDHDDFSFRASGLDAQLLYSYEASRTYSYNLALRGSWHSYREVYNGVHNGPYDIWQGGLTTGIRKDVGKIFLQTELGVEVVRNTEGSLIPYIPVSIGFGFRK